MSPSEAHFFLYLQNILIYTNKKRCIRRDEGGYIGMYEILKRSILAKRQL
jgi:hypothetical protein